MAAVAHPLPHRPAHREAVLSLSAVPPSAWSAWLPPPCRVCGDETELGPLPQDEGFSPDERICLRCGQALLLGPAGVGSAAPVAEAAGQPRSA